MQLLATQMSEAHTRQDRHSYYKRVAYIAVAARLPLLIVLLAMAGAETMAHGRELLSGRMRENTDTRLQQA